MLQQLQDAYVWSFSEVSRKVAARMHGAVVIDTNVIAMTHKILNANLSSAIDRGDNVVIDDCNLSAYRRGELLELVKGKFDQYVCCHFLTPLASQTAEYGEWRFRLNYRSKLGLGVTDDMLKQMLLSQETPCLSEGFDSLQIYDLWGQLSSQKT